MRLVPQRLRVKEYNFKKNKVGWEEMFPLPYLDSPGLCRALYHACENIFKIVLLPTSHC